MWNPFKRTYKGQICGHETKLHGYITTHDGEKIEFKQKATDGKVDYCIDCLSKMTIRCAWCGEYIGVGDPVTLYSPVKKFDIPDYAVKYQDSPDSHVCLVGCLRWDCAQTGADRSGFWMPSGKNDCRGEVHRVMSPMEAILRGNSDEPVFVGDISSIEEAHKIQDKALEK